MQVKKTKHSPRQQAKKGPERCTSDSKGKLGTLNIQNNLQMKEAMPRHVDEKMRKKQVLPAHLPSILVPAGAAAAADAAAGTEYTGLGTPA